MAPRFEIRNKVFRHSYDFSKVIVLFERYEGHIFVNNTRAIDQMEARVYATTEN